MLLDNPQILRDQYRCALLDDVVVQGDVGTIVARVREHLDAGADHVCVQLRAPDPTDLSIDAYRELAAGLGDLLD